MQAPVVLNVANATYVYGVNPFSPLMIHKLTSKWPPIQKFKKYENRNVLVFQSNIATIFLGISARAYLRVLIGI
jgi:hypothetical protein